MAVGNWDAESILPWLQHGALVGILEEVETAGVFPPCHGDVQPRNPASLFTFLVGWSNYTCAKDEAEVVNQLLQAPEGMGHCLFFDTLNEFQNYLGVGHVVLSKLALTTELKPDGSPKHPLIQDHFRSDFNTTVSLAERIVLPPAGRRRGRRQAPPQGPRRHTEWLVANVAHAFHNIPIRPSERQFMCGMVGSRCLVFKVLGMGGKSSPNVWGWLAAAIGRVVSSVFCGDEIPCEICVDDPLLAAGRSLGERSRTFTVALLAIAVLGSPWLGTKPVSVTVWCGSAPSSRLRTSASQWPCPRTSLMPCTGRRPDSCQPQVQKRKMSDHSAASFRSLLVRSRRCDTSLT